MKLSLGWNMINETARVVLMDLFVRNAILPYVQSYVRRKDGYYPGTDLRRWKVRKGYSWRWPRPRYSAGGLFFKLSPLASQRVGPALR